MTDREKLIDILEQAGTMRQFPGSLARILMENGVTFATDNNVGSKWIPVTERLPEKMCQCVCRYVFGKNTEYPFFQVLWYFANLEEPHFQHEGSMGLTVTHWMPLPEPPKEVE